MSIYEDRPWLKNYPSGVPANIDTTQYPNLVTMLIEGCKNHASQTAFTCMDSHITYKELDRYSTQFAAYLQSRGMEQGDRIALMMPNLLQYPIATLGALKAGLVIVNTNPLYTAREMKHQFDCSQVKAIVIAENFAHNLQDVLSSSQIKTVIVTSIGEMMGFFKGGLVNFTVRHIKRKVPSYQITNHVTFKQALSDGKKFTLVDKPTMLHDVIVHQYTGGTTGVSKGAMLTNENIIANVLQIRAWMDPQLGSKDLVSICPIPLYHSFAFTVNCCAMICIGTQNILVVNPRELKSIIKEFKKYPINLMTGVNTLFNALNHSGLMEGVNFGSLKVCIAGGMALQNQVAEEWKRLTSVPVIEGYGLTETSPVATVNPIDGTGVQGSIGLPVSSTIVKVVREDGSEAEMNEAGELWIKGPQVMKGYYERQEETDKVLQHGWLKTGDIGKMIEGGFFVIVDRKKDMINVSGFNVYPNEIEEVLCTHPKVLEAAVIGIPHERSGEVVKAFIVAKDKSLKKEELIAWASKNLTNYKIPKEVEFRNDLPKSNIGKILRKALREN